MPGDLGPGEPHAAPARPGDEGAPLTLPREVCSDLRQALRREWLETNGLGSFAAGTVAGAATRRYHALLCVATRPPVGRMVLVNGIESAILDGTERHELGTNVYLGAVHPEGYKLLVGFRLDPWPVWTWRIGNITVERELFMPHGLQATVQRWRVRGGRVELALRPLLSGRDYHSTHHENSTLSSRAEIEAGEGGLVTLTPYPSLPSVRLHHNGRYTHQPDWYRRFIYAVERERGLDFEEDLFSPGELRYTLGDGDVAELVLTTDGGRRWGVEDLARGERARRAQLVRGVSAGDGIRQQLTRAADQFIVARAGGSTVIAGYPWFTDWGRDTFIALAGLTLTTGRHSVARELLAAFAPWVSQGMIPNRFPDGTEAPEYNTVDASLWYVIAAGQYLAQAGDTAFAVATLWPVARAIIEGYRRGTRYRISVGADGLVSAGAPGVQLTWMDAKIDDWVVTPRIGKPVEIQALWIRALAAAAELARRAGDGAFAVDAEAMAARARSSLRDQFWHEAGGYLADVVEGDGDRRDTSLRPNQLYALALDPPVFDPQQAEFALDAVERNLLVPYGLRTLAPGDRNYAGRCTGTQRDRDSAYHQGTVWPHLLGVYADAVWQVRRRRVGRQLAAQLAQHLGDGGIGQISEIFDGDAPHEPRGCFAQAWAVAELLRITAEPR